MTKIGWVVKDTTGCRPQENFFAVWSKKKDAQKFIDDYRYPWSRKVVGLKLVKVKIKENI